MEKANNLETLREAVLNYRRYTFKNDDEKTEEEVHQEKIAGFSVIVQLLHFFALHPEKMSQEEQEGFLFRLKRASINFSHDTLEGAYDFLAYEIVYSAWLCRLFQLPSRDEEEEEQVEKSRKHAE